MSIANRTISNRRFIIGVTGNSGGGKGAVTALLAARGGLALDADELAHEALLPGNGAYRPVLEAFGPGILAEGHGHAIDRGKLGEIVFRDAGKLRELEKIVHRAVKERMAEILADRDNDRYPFAVIDAPLLIEAGLHEICDRVWLVTAPESVRRRRIMERDHLTAEQADLRLKNQIPDEKRLPFVQRVIANGGSLDELREQVGKIMDEIESAPMDLAACLHEYMTDTGADYALCGGHSIDLFLGRKTRPHKDLDVVIFWEDRDQIVRGMLDDNWEMYEPCGAEGLHKINNVRDQKRIRNNIWCLKPGNPRYQFTALGKDMYSVSCDNAEQFTLDYVEILCNTRQAGEFLFARNHDIKLPMEKAIVQINGIPCLAPELVLLYKSSSADIPDYQLDFVNTLPSLAEEQLMWLKKALIIQYPDGHPWLAEL